MDRAKFNRAQQIRERIKDLTILKRALEGNSEIWCGSVNEATFGRKISQDMKKTLLKMCIGEIAILEKEFEAL
ncbi:MAG: hypothetical protein K1W34_14035 [Lachnospiraceae bacterium]